MLAPFDFSWTDTLHLGVIQNYFNTIVNIEVPKVSETYSVRKDSFPGFLDFGAFIKIHEFQTT